MLPFWASRCFRSEFPRIILALAARTASVLVGCCFGCGGFAAFPTLGIIGSTCVGRIEPRSMGCVLIGPVGVGLLLSILGTASRSVTMFVRSQQPARRDVPLSNGDGLARDQCRAASARLNLGER
jgi:hypothetical protein